MTVSTTHSNLATAFTALSGVGGVPSWLQAARTAAFARFTEHGWPAAKDEDWRQTDLSAMLRIPWQPAPMAAQVNATLPANLAEVVARHVLPGDGPLVVTLDGQWLPEQSRLSGLPAGVRVQEWPDYLSAGGTARLLAEPASRHPFALLNEAFSQDGLVLVLGPEVQLREPLQILHLTSGTTAGQAYFPRTVLQLERQAKATVVETFATLGEAAYLRAPVLLATLGAEAQLDLYQRQAEGQAAFHFQHSQVQLGRAAQARMVHVATGAILGRQDLLVNLAGEGAHAELQAAYLGAGRQVLDHHTTLRHSAPHGTSRQVYKGILDGKASGIFHGRIHVLREAQRTDAQQSNRALLLTGDAKVYSKPQLEIFADDVRCTHGATVGQLDPDQAFYLRARGIGEVAARAMLTMAFVGEVLTSIKLPAWRKALEQELGHRFGVDT